ncbi:MAG: adenylate/guanylate cyclase domain-containing protein [Spirochaetes bacterium]|nr:adenylate/guanylate cyclase domain-containing protein [Spirochaetota bacterium]
MIDTTLVKDITEMLAKSLTFPDIEWMGKYFFKDFSSHKILNIRDTQSISPLTASNALVTLCQEKNKIDEFFQFVIELDGTVLNGKIVKLSGLENILFRLSRTGVYFDFNKRKITKVNEDKNLLVNWGALKDGKEYPMIIASIDICGNSELVKKYNTNIMEQVYFQLWGYIKKKILQYDGRIWYWAGDGGIVAFRNDIKGPSYSINCCFEILLALPVFNLWHSKPIKEDIRIRIGMDMGEIKFFSDTGRIISDVINYAAHLEKKGTDANGLSISETIYNILSEKMKLIFKNKKIFEDKTAYSLVYKYENALA